MMTDKLMAVRQTARVKAWKLAANAKRACRESSGQGTTEYAILVGVLVLMAIVAVVAMRDNLQKLWSAITDGINSL